MSNVISNLKVPLPVANRTEEVKAERRKAHVPMNIFEAARRAAVELGNNVAEAAQELQRQADAQKLYEKLASNPETAAELSRAGIVNGATLAPKLEAALKWLGFPVEPHELRPVEMPHGPIEVTPPTRTPDEVLATFRKEIAALNACGSSAAAAQDAVAALRTALNNLPAHEQGAVLAAAHKEMAELLHATFKKLEPGEANFVVEQLIQLSGELTPAAQRELFRDLASAVQRDGAGRLTAALDSAIKNDVEGAKHLRDAVVDVLRFRGDDLDADKLSHRHPEWLLGTHRIY